MPSSIGLRSGKRLRSGRSDSSALKPIHGQLLLSGGAICAKQRGAIHNVVAASATVGLLGRKGQVLRMTTIPTTYYLSMTGLLTLIALHVLGVTDFLM